MANTVTLQTYFRELSFMLDDGAPTEVVSHCRYILQHFPKNVAVYRLLGQALLQKGQNEVQPQLLDEAGEIFRRVLSAQPDDYVAHLGLGEIAQQRDALDEALWHFERAAEQTPGNSVLQDTIRQLYEKRGTPGAAGERLPLTRVTLARQYLKANALDQALNEIRSVLEDEPDRLDLHMLEADALWASGRWVEAGEAAAHVLHRCPDCLSANRIMASLWLKYKRPTDAQPFLARLEALDPVAAARVLRADGAEVDAIALPRLDYNTKAAASLTSEMPEWVQDLDETDQYMNPFEAPRSGPEPITMPAFHEEPPSVGVPDWAAVFAGMGAEPEQDEVRTRAPERGALQDDSDDQLPEDVWDDPYTPPQVSALPPSPDVPEWFSESLTGQSAPAEASYDAGEWSGAEDFAPDEFEPEQDAQGDKTPEFDSFLRDISGLHGGTAGLDERLAAWPTPDVLPGSGGTENLSDAPMSDAGYALDWMNELEIPAAGEPAPGLDFLSDEPSAWGPLTGPVDEDDGDWVADQVTAPDGEPEADLSEGDWLSVLASRSAPAEETVVPADEPEEGVTLSEDDWIARLSTGPLGSETPPDSVGPIIDALVLDASSAGRIAADDADTYVTAEEELPGIAADDFSAEEEAPAARPTITEDEMELLRRASMPPPDLDVNTLFGSDEEEAVPAVEIPSWLQSLEPEVASKQDSEYQAEEESGTTEIAEMLTAAPSLFDEPQANDEIEIQPGDASELFGWLSDSTVDEAAEAESDLIGALGLSSSALPGTVELDAELLAFFESPQDTVSRPEHAQPDTPDAADVAAEIGWVEPSAEAQNDWLGAYAAPEAEEQPWVEPETALPADGGVGEWMPQDVGDSFDPSEAMTGLQPEEDEPGAADEELGILALLSEPIEAVDVPEIPEDQVLDAASELAIVSAGADVPVDDGAEEGAAKTPSWLAEIEPEHPDSPLLTSLDTLLNKPYDPFEGGREDQVPTYAAVRETGILQPNEQPDWMTAFLGGDEPEPTSLDTAEDEVADFADASNMGAALVPIQGEGVLEPDSEADWLTALGEDEDAESGALVRIADEVQMEPPSESELRFVVPGEQDEADDESHGVYVPLPSRQPKLNYMPDWLAAIASEGKKLDAELLKAVEQEQPALPATDAPPATSSPVDLGVEDAGGYDLVESDAWLGEEIADRPSPVTEAEGPVVLPAHTDLLYDLSAQESLLETETADDANDLTFLEELDQVDWLPDVREGPVSEEVTIEDELLADLDLQELGDVLAPARNLEPEADVAPVWDLPDTTNDARAPHRDYAPPDDFSFDDEQPAWLRGQDGDEPKSSPSRGLPEWLRPPDEDQH